MNAKQFGEVIKEAGKRKRMTQEELANMLGIGILTASFYKNGVFKVPPFIDHAKMSRLKEQEKLIKAANAELEEWRLSGDVDYLHKTMAVIRAEIKKEDEDEEHLNLKDRFAIDGKEYILSTVALPIIGDEITNMLLSIAPFETMLFGIDENGRVNWIDLYCERYYWAEEAKERHKELAEKARNGVKFWEEE